MQIFKLKRFHINAKLAQKLTEANEKLVNLVNFHIDEDLNEITIIKIDGFQQGFDDACALWDALSYTYTKACEIVLENPESY